MREEWKSTGRIFLIIVLPVILGVALMLILWHFQVDFPIIIACFVASLALLAVNVLYNLSYLRRAKAAAGLLEAGRPQEYILEVEKLLQTAKGQRLRTILQLNLAAGYMDARDFDTAIPMLEELPDKRLTMSDLLLVHRVNLCQCYFETARLDKATALYQDNRSLFQQYEDHELYGGSVAVVNIRAAIQEGRREEAERMLDAARSKWPDPRLQASLQKIADILAQQSQGE